MKATHERNLEVQRKIFERNTVDLEGRCKDKLSQLEADLELRRKVHIHEIEERKNLHINDLMHNHEKAFENMKTYYNDITNDNLKLIRDLKEEVAEMKKKQGEYAKNMYSISLENQRLKEPLTKAVAEVASLRAQLKDRDKDRLSLRNAKARLQVLEGKRSELRQHHKQMQADFVAVESERDQLYGTFETAIKNVQQKTDFRLVCPASCRSVIVELTCVRTLSTQQCCLGAKDEGGSKRCRSNGGDCRAGRLSSGVPVVCHWLIVDVEIRLQTAQNSTRMRFKALRLQSMMP